jgi:AMP-binding enzyme
MLHSLSVSRKAACHCRDIREYVAKCLAFDTAHQLHEYQGTKIRHVSLRCTCAACSRTHAARVGLRSSGARASQCHRSGRVGAAAQLPTASYQVCWRCLRCLCLLVSKASNAAVHAVWYHRHAKDCGHDVTSCTSFRTSDTHLHEILLLSFLLVTPVTRIPIVFLRGASHGAATQSRSRSGTCLQHLGMALIHRVVDHVAEHAAHTPKAVAISCQGEATTYGQLMARVDAIAHVLHQQGIKKGDYVGIMLERCAFIASATRTTGGWYLSGFHDPPHRFTRARYSRRPASHNMCKILQFAVHVTVPGASSLLGADGSRELCGPKRAGRGYRTSRPKLPVGAPASSRVEICFAWFTVGSSALWREEHCELLAPSTGLQVTCRGGMIARKVLEHQVMTSNCAEFLCP